MGRAIALESLIAGLRNNSGEPLAAGKVYSYEPGTTTAKALYTEQDKSVESANPAVLDAYGRKQLWADGAYKLVIKDSADTTIQTLDDQLYGITDYEPKWCGLAEGSANAFTVSTATGLSAYQAGQIFIFRSNQNITGASTLNVDSLGAKDIKTPNGAATRTNDIRDTTLVVVVYNGTDMIKISSHVPVNTAWEPTYGGSGSMTFSSVTNTFAKYWLFGDLCFFVARAQGTVGGTPNTALHLSAPVALSNSNTPISAYVYDNGGFVGAAAYVNATASRFEVLRYDRAVYTAGDTRIYIGGVAEVA